MKKQRFEELPGGIREGGFHFAGAEARFASL
jgi:hypothetical protein